MTTAAPRAAPTRGNQALSQSWDAGGLPVSCPHCRQRFHTGWSHLATIFLWLEWCFLWNVGVFWKVLPGQPQGFPDCPCPWARPCGSTFLASPPAVLQFLFCPPPPLLVQLPALALDRAGLRHLRHPQGHSGSRLPVSSKGLEGRAGQAGPMGATGLWEQRGLVGSQQGRQPPPTLDSRGPSGHKGQGRASEEGNRGSGPPQQLPSPAPSLQGQPRVSILLEATVAGLAVSSLPFVGMRGMWAGPGGLGHFLPPPLLLSSLWAPPALPSLGAQLSGPSRPRVRLLGRLQPELVLREEGGRLGAGAGGESRTSRAARELVPAAVSWASGSNRSSLGRDSLPGSRGRLLYKAFFFFLQPISQLPEGEVSVAHLTQNKCLLLWEPALASPRGAGYLHGPSRTPGLPGRVSWKQVARSKGGASVPCAQSLD